MEGVRGDEELFHLSRCKISPVTNQASRRDGRITTTLLVHHSAHGGEEWQELPRRSADDNPRARGKGKTTVQSP